MDTKKTGSTSTESHFAAFSFFSCEVRQLVSAVPRLDEAAAAGAEMTREHVVAAGLLLVLERRKHQLFFRTKREA